MGHLQALVHRSRGLGLAHRAREARADRALAVKVAPGLGAIGRNLLLHERLAQLGDDIRRAVDLGRDLGHAQPPVAERENAAGKLDVAADRDLAGRQAEDELGVALVWEVMEERSQLLDRRRRRDPGSLWRAASARASQHPSGAQASHPPVL